MPSPDLRDSIIQIRHVGNESIVGTGFVVGEQLILTCAHVVVSAGHRPGDRVKIVFHVNGESRLAEVLPKAWRSPEGADVAVLRLEDDLPDRVTPLILSEAAGCDGHRFRAFGYPRIGKVEGFWATGEIKGLVRQADGRQLLQLASAELDQGISGSPVLDLIREQVVGMVTEVHYPDRTTKHRDTGLATPAEVLHQACPEIVLQPAPLRELIVVDGRLHLSRLLNRQIQAALFARLRRWAALRPVQAVLSLLFLTMIGLLAVMAIRSFQNRDWRAISGGQAILGTPANSCSLPTQPFEIQIAEVTNAAYLECVRAGACAPPRSIWQAGPQGPVYPAGLDQHPVFGLTWDDADNYCRFIGARLPTEAEWVRAARGGTAQSYPWGDTFDSERANVFESRIGNTVEVTAFPDGRNADGIYQLCGNAREWVADSATDSCDFTKGQGAHVTRGGSFQDAARNATLWSRFQGNDLPYVGVRCVRDIRP